MRSRHEIFDEASRKRGPPEPIDGLDAAKRQKLGAQMPTTVPKFHVPPLKPGPHTVAELFTVTPDEGLKAFDVSQLSEDLVVKIGITILQKLDADTLNQAIEVCTVVYHWFDLLIKDIGSSTKIQVISSSPTRRIKSSNRAARCGRGRR
jgi:hypothetical protein